ncbi:hypothetical protein CesoFtcFv8_016751 [Champsocephalus esox]|uniref:Uncharacterized protein n=1 Tax=Champsocephalus esox TaxID=159716 RepID=A0AAN8GTU0_9TELE|nr:hypothetical protein CesoFtcFv8_016751 [Champsocephalus esox]
MLAPCGTRISRPGAAPAELANHVTQPGMQEADIVSECGGGVEVRWLQDGGREALRLAEELGSGFGAVAVVLIPSWKAEEKCEGPRAGEAVHHCEVLCTPFCPTHLE